MAQTRYPLTIDGETLEVGTASELAVALHVLRGQHDRAVLKQLAPHLADIISTPLGLYNTLRSLAPANQRYPLEALGPRLVSTLQSARPLRDILAILSSPEVEEALLRTLGAEGLGHLIVTARGLAEVLEWVYGDCDRLLLDLLGLEPLRRMLRTGHDLSLVLHSLSGEVQLELVERLGWDWVAKRPVDGRDLAYLLRALPAALGSELLGHYSRADLVDLIGNEGDWAFLCQRLEAEEAARLFNILGVERDA